MKFAIKSEQAPTRTPMTDAEFFMHVDNMCMDFDIMDSEAGIEPREALENLYCLENFLENGSEAAIKDFVASNEDLCEFVDKIPELTALVKKDIKAAEEGLADELLGDGIIKWLVGRKMTTLEYLKPALDECEDRLNKAKATKVESRANTWIFGRPVSRFLPSVSTFNSCAAAIDKVAKLLKGTPNLKDFQASKVKDCLKGSVYLNLIDGKLKGQQEDNWGHVAIMMLPYALSFTGIGGFAAGVYAGFFYDPLKPVAARGWKDLPTFQTGLKTTREIVANMESIADSAKRLLDGAKSEEEKAQAQEVNTIAKWVITEAGHLGRGYVTAAKKVTAGFFGRVGRNLVHA